MSKKYGAMVDDNNVNVYNEAHDPVIIFNTKKAVEEIGADFVLSSEIKDNYEYVKNELDKKGKNIAL